MALLYVVGTPIGNLGDFTPRAREILELADFIAAEDTRVTVKLLNHMGIKKPMISYYEHNLRERGEQIVARILGGETCAVVSDAGMPCISDPGEDLVRLCAENGIEVQVIPGPSAAISALAISGLPTSRFTFEGFLSTNKRNRKEHLASVSSEQRTMIFYEAPHKLVSTLSDMLNALGDRDIALCRELTKLHEEVIRTTFSGALSLYKDTSPKGEFVLVISGAVPPVVEEMTIESAVLMAKELIEKGQKATEAAKAAAKASGFTKNEIYSALLE